MKKIVINTFTTLTVMTLLLALLHFINWSLFFIVTGTMAGFIIACLTVYNYGKISEQYRVSQLKKCHGKDYTATIAGIDIKGKIVVKKESNTVFAYLCFNENIAGAKASNDYAHLEDKLGFKNAWFVAFLDSDSLNMAGVEKFNK